MIGMWHARTKEDEVSLLLKSDFLIRKKQDEVTADQDIEGLHRIPGCPLITGFSLCVSVPFQFQFLNSKGVILAWHKMADKPATSVLGCDANIPRYRPWRI